MEKVDVQTTKVPSRQSVEESCGTCKQKWSHTALQVGTKASLEPPGNFTGMHVTPHPVRVTPAASSKNPIRAPVTTSGRTVRIRYPHGKFTGTQQQLTEVTENRAQMWWCYPQRSAPPTLPKVG
jgi:hypothetical protein